MPLFNYFDPIMSAATFFTDPFKQLIVIEFIGLKDYPGPKSHTIYALHIIGRHVSKRASAFVLSFTILVWAQYIVYDK